LAAFLFELCHRERRRQWTLFRGWRRLGALLESLGRKNGILEAPSPGLLAAHWRSDHECQQHEGGNQRTRGAPEDYPPQRDRIHEGRDTSTLQLFRSFGG
jgi:hypothetical protein